MSSAVEICNMALSQIGAGSINSLTESSIEAQQCNLYYTVLLNQMLSDSNWNFATTIEPLAVTTEEVFNWVYAYAYPSACLKVHHLIPNHQQYSSDTGVASRYRYADSFHMPEIEEPEYQVLTSGGQKLIVSNYAGLRIQYTKKITDPNDMPDNFRLALSNLIASRIAIAITGVSEGRALKQDALKEYAFYKDKAKEQDANESLSYMPESDFITIRR